MKIEVFEYIRKATKQLNDKKPQFEAVATELIEYLNKLFNFNGDVVSVSHRVKTAESLREKILRNELYKKIEIDSLFDGLSDVIGVRLGCRFLKDEQVFYKRIKNHFFLEKDDGHFCHPDNDRIYFNLDAPQPERQRNGFDIYRIDGYILSNGEKLRFELQIKALINNFWSDIEHRLIYKNKRYLGDDNFIRELMNSIYENLVNIDRQLGMLYNRNIDRSNTEFFTQTENILTIMIDELSSELVEYKTGIALNMNEYSQSLVKYILAYTKGSDNVDKLKKRLYIGENNNETDFTYSDVVLNLIKRINRMDFNAIPIGDEIILPADIVYSDELTERIGKKFSENINADFFVNTFFHILFALGTGGEALEFSRFCKYYSLRISEGDYEKNKQRIFERINDEKPEKMLLEKTINSISAQY